MRAKRSKAYKRAMALYTSTYKFREPFQVVCDAEFLQSAAAQKLDITARLEAILGGSVKPMITQCSIAHLYKAGEAGQPAVNLARSFERRKCNHWQTKETDAECISGIMGTDENRFRYCVATQSASLRSKLRKVPGVPLLFEKRAVILLEPPSDASIGQKRKIEEGKLHVPKEELKLTKPKKRKAAEAVDSTVDEVPIDEEPVASTSTVPSGAEANTGLPAATRSLVATTPMTAEQLLARRDRSLKRKRGGPKEPNPLSVKRKKSASSDAKRSDAKRMVRLAGGSKSGGNDEDKQGAKLGAPDAPVTKSAEQPESETRVIVRDQSKGKTRPQGDGTSKKALKRKKLKAQRDHNTQVAGGADVALLVED